MKILLSTPFDFDCPGGVNAHVYHLDRELQRMGHVTRILSPGTSNGEVEDDGHYCRIGKAIPVRANGSTARVTLSPFLNDAVQAFLERERFDVIHLHDPLMPMLNLAVLANSTTINIGTFHGSSSSAFGFHSWYWLGKPIFSRFFNRVHYRIAVSAVAHEFTNYYFPAAYDLIPNGIDYDSYGPDIEPDPMYRSDQPTVLFVGRFDESRKGFRYLLEAMGHVQQAIPDARLLVVGPGDPSWYQNMIRRYRIRNVIFTGEIPKEDLPHMYAAADVFCAPSTGKESFGIVLLEAMASGKPVIATDLRAYRLVARHNREALLVNPANSENLGRAIRNVLQDSELSTRLGQAGRERAALYSWPTIARRVVECYEWAARRNEQVRPPLTALPLASSTRRP